MRVLMLGWEFPPHISGGLGTACFGLTQGLSQHGVEVLFVVPRARGDEDARFVKILGANEVVIEDEVELPPRRVVRERVEEGVDVVETKIDVPVEVLAERIASDEELAAVAGVGRAEAQESSLVVDVRSRPLDTQQPLDEEPDRERADRWIALEALRDGGRTEAGTDERFEYEDEAAIEVQDARLRRTFEVLAVDSLLRPYLTEREYVTRWEQVGGTGLTVPGTDRRNTGDRSQAPTAPTVAPMPAPMVPGIGRRYSGDRCLAPSAQSVPDADRGPHSSQPLAPDSDALQSIADTASGSPRPFTLSSSRTTTATQPRTQTITLRRHVPWKRIVREEHDEPVSPRTQRRLLEFSGVYGSNLMDEVARYAFAVETIAADRTDFDVIHAHDWMSFPAGLAAARASKKPLVIHVHACEHDRSGDRPNTRVQEIEQLGLDGADRVVCVSHYTAAQIRRHYRVDEKKLRIVHNALTQKEQADRVKATKQIDAPIVLFLGRVTFQKGPDYFLEAASRVVRVRPDVKFVIAGSGDMLPAMIERVARMGLARNVHFTGFLTGEDVERMYAMADVYVMPSVSEPFGIAPLEAMALDTPVILSRQSGVSEVLRSALKVDFWDVADIANKILAVLAYPALTVELRDEGREEVRAMRWERPAGLVRDAYVELVGTR